ncbi:hypothetical protein RYO59_001597 [Thermosynechococcaceae cyanobacterium Okahandja]
MGYGLGAYALLVWATPLWAQAPTPPPALIQQAIATAAAQFGEDPSQITVAQVQPRVWSDGCLGLGGLRADCPERLTPGWELTLTNPTAPYPQQWVYRSNQSGSLLLWDAAGSRMIGTLIQPPRQLAPEDQPAPLPEAAIFRVIRQTTLDRPPQVTLLLSDGRIVQETRNPRGETLSRTLRTIAPTLVAGFTTLLQERRFQRFDGVDFVTPTTPTPVATNIISTPTATVRIPEANEHRLASDLVAVLRAWAMLIERGQLPKTR